MAGLAYDYSLFESSPSKEQPKQQKPQLKMVRSQPRAFAGAFSPKVVCTFLVVVALLSLIVYCQVCLNEVTGQISRLKEEISILDSDSMRYASLLESTVSLRAVAQQAEEELGMSKLDQYQTCYVYLYEKDQIVLAENPQTQTADDSVFAVIGSLLGTAKEYFGGK